MYLKAVLLFALLASIVGAYGYGLSNGKAIEKSVNQAERIERDAEILRLQNEIAAAKGLAEQKIIEERIVYRDRIKVVKQSVNECVIPADILRVLYDAGIYTGEL